MAEMRTDEQTDDAIMEQIKSLDTPVFPFIPGEIVMRADGNHFGVPYDLHFAVVQEVDYHARTAKLLLMKDDNQNRPMFATTGEVKDADIYNMYGENGLRIPCTAAEHYGMTDEDTDQHYLIYNHVADCVGDQ